VPSQPCNATKTLQPGNLHQATVSCVATLSALDVNLVQPEKWGDLGVDSNPQKLGNNQQKSVENGDWLVVLTILKNISQWEGL